MNRLTLALTVSLFCAALSALAGTGVELQPASSPGQDENKNSTEIFDYETTYTGKSDFKDVPMAGLARATRSTTTSATPIDF